MLTFLCVTIRPKW